MDTRESPIHPTQDSEVLQAIRRAINYINTYLNLNPNSPSPTPKSPQAKVGGKSSSIRTVFPGRLVRISRKESSSKT